MAKFFLAFVVLITLHSLVSSCFSPAIYSFGDSLLDAGNNRFIENCTTQANFRPYGSSYFPNPTGRFTNGRTVPDFLSEFLGIPFQQPYLEASLAVANGSTKKYPSNGINFASAGSGVFNLIGYSQRDISLQEQLRQFRTLVENNQIDKSSIPQSLFLFESGSNDILSYIMLPLGDTAESYANDMLSNVRDFVEEIYKLGARRIVLLGVGPLGCVPGRVMLPGAPTNSCMESINRVAKIYNRGLETLAHQIFWKYHGAVGTYGAVYDIAEFMRTFPLRYGFANVSSACCGGGTLGGDLQCGTGNYTVCKNPNQFFFWDYLHPTEHAYGLVAKALWGGILSDIRPLNLRTLADTLLVRVGV